MTRTTGSGIARKMMAFLLCVVLAAGNMSVPVLAAGETAVPEESLVEMPAEESVPEEETSEIVPEETVEANSEAVSEENVEAADPAEEVGEGEAAEYHITVAEGIANGTVTVSTETAASGETITVTCTPSKEPFKLYYLRLNGQDVVCENMPRFCERGKSFYFAVSWDGYEVYHVFWDCPLFGETSNGKT